MFNYGMGYGGGLGYGAGLDHGAGCICNFPTLIILILIVLQFSRRGHGYRGGCC